MQQNVRFEADKKRKPLMNQRWDKHTHTHTLVNKVFCQLRLVCLVTLVSKSAILSHTQADGRHN